ncbi:MAG TPA: DUF805 domain-containing protein [Gammaproteobacteria bacterium]|nr:DUF805 domain-containing protein [Gammaproteobacteria bacterium]
MDGQTRQPWLIMSDSRIGRLRYLAYSVTVNLLFLLLLGLSMWLMFSGHALFGGVFYVIVSLSSAIFSYAFSIRRLHDINASGWWALIAVPMLFFGIAHGFGWRPHNLMLIAFVVGYLALLIYACVLIFTPGTSVANRFGPPPPPNSGWVVAGAVSALSLPFVACAAAIVIPAYQVNAIRSEVEDGVQTGFAAQHAILDYVGAHQAWPADLKSAFPQAARSPVSRFVSQIELTTCTGNRCGLTVFFDDGNSDRRIQGRSLELWTEDGGSTWPCGPGHDNPLSALYLPPACRESGAP